MASPPHHQSSIVFTYPTLLRLCTPTMASELVLSLQQSWKSGLSEPSYSFVESIFDDIRRLTTVEFISFFAAPEASSILQNYLTHANSAIRSCAIKWGSRCMIRLWELLHEYEIEGGTQFDTLAEALRRKDDLLDSIVDIFKQLAKVVCMKFSAHESNDAAKSSDMSTFNASCQGIIDLFELFHGQNILLNRWIESVCGSEGLHSQLAGSQFAQLQRRRIIFGPLIQVAVVDLFEDLPYLIQRTETLSSIQYHLALVIQHAILVHFVSVAPRSANSYLFMHSKDLASFYMDDSVDPSNLSRTGLFPVDIVSLTSEWLESFLSRQFLDSYDLHDAWEVLKLMVNMVQFPFLARSKLQVSFLLMERVLSLLDRAGEIHTCSTYERILAMGVLVFRQLVPFQFQQPPSIDSRYVECACKLVYHLQRIVNCDARQVSTKDTVLFTRLLCELIIAVVCTLGQDGAIAFCQAIDPVELGNKAQKYQTTPLKTILNALVKSNFISLQRSTLFGELFVLTLSQTIVGTLKCLVYFVSQITDRAPSFEEEIEDDLKASCYERIERILDEFCSSKCEHAEQYWFGCSFLQHFEYLVALTTEEIAKEMTARCGVESNGLNYSMLIEKSLGRKGTMIIDMMLSLIDDAVFLIQMFAGCFRWNGPLTPSSSRALLDIAQFISDISINDPLHRDQAYVSVANYLMSSTQYSNEMKSRRHLVFLIVLSLLDSCVKSSGVHGANGDNIEGKLSLELLTNTSLSELFIFVACQVLPYSFEFNRDVSVLLPRLHFLCHFASLQLLSSLQGEYIDNIAGQACSGVLGGDLSLNACSDQSTISRQMVYQFLAIQLLESLSLSFRDSSDVLKVMMPFVLDLANSIFSSEKCRMEATIGGSCERSWVLQSALHTGSTSFLGLNNAPAVRERITDFIFKFIRVLNDHPSCKDLWINSVDAAIESCSRQNHQIDGHCILQVHISSLSDSFKQSVGGELPISSMTSCQLRSLLNTLTEKDLLSAIVRSNATERNIVDSGALNSEEICAILTDIVTANISLASDLKTMQDGSGQSVESDVAITTFEPTLTQLSGTNDVVTVFGGWTHINQASQTATLRLRLFNNSQCKIPYFSIKILIHTITARGPVCDSVLFSSDGLIKDSYGQFVHKSANDQLRVGSSSMLGGEFVPPGAMVERDFRVQLVSFSQVTVTVRIVFPELEPDRWSVINPVSHDSTQLDRGIRYTACTPLQLSSPSYLSHFGVGRSSLSAVNSWSALVNCIPLELPMQCFLLPYGSGAFSLRRKSLRSLFGYGDINVLIPWRVGKSLFERLGSRYSHFCAVGSKLDSAIISCDVIVHAVMFAEFLNSKCCTVSGIGTDCMSIPREDYSVRGGFQGNSAVGSLLWSLQTLWGSQISVLLQIDVALNHVGNLHIRCSDSDTLSTVVSGLEELVEDLSGGSLALVD